MRILIENYDASWPELFQREADRIRTALAARVLAVEHVGSTSVPGLAAKPVIDVLLVVADSSDELSYAPALEAAGYTLKFREPDWFEHRLFKSRDPDVNLHVLSQECPEIECMLLFRDWLRSNPEDRDRYAAAKLALAGREWRTVDEYAQAKTGMVQEILARGQETRGINSGARHSDSSAHSSPPVDRKSRTQR
jgi:GrpB-like predicted nucleotidyltransferase (UPF0157 family)